jgi:multisubunit Na+/H+ antiporter MnhC subunit
MYRNRAILSSVPVSSFNVADPSPLNYPISTSTNEASEPTSRRGDKVRWPALALPVICARGTIGHNRKPGWDPFSYICVLTSIVAGLAVTRLVSGLGQLLRTRARTPMEIPKLPS